LLDAGDLDAAEVLLRGILADAPRSAGVLMRLGQLSRRRGNHAEAIGHFEAALHAAPSSIPVQRALANARRMVDRPDQAVAVPPPPVAPVSGPPAEKAVLQVSEPNLPNAVIAPRTRLEIGTCNLAPTSRFTITGPGHRLAIGDATQGNFELIVEGRDCDLEIGRKVIAVMWVQIVMLRGPSRFRLGSGTTAQGRVTFHMHEASELVIGADCMFASNVSFLTSDAHPIYDADRVRINAAAPIVLGEHVWVCEGASILKGAHIGAGCVVARGAVVAGGRYPERAILAGVPAKVVRENVYWERKFTPAAG
jgi:acetyltransferase-like isoleucine patch superfamily enzyme